MTQDNARAGQGARYAGSPIGFRRLTPGLMKTDRTAELFAGLPEGVTMHGQLLAAFKAAAPRLGLSLRVVHAVDWLFKFTQPQDWGRVGHPIVWPSSAMQQEALGLSPTRVKAVNRAMIECGLIAMKDSPNGKRYGKRDTKGRIVEAYGFDLAPIAARYAEFVQLAREAKEERDAMRQLRRRVTIARNGITQILETAAEYGLQSDGQGEEWTRLARDTQETVRVLRLVENPDDLALGVDNLEHRQRAGRERLENLLAGVTVQASEPVNSDPLGSENGPHQYTYKPNLYPQKDTVIADKKGSGAEGEAVPSPSPPVLREVTETGRVLKLRPDELARLAPRLRPYLHRAKPTWPDIIDAAAFLRADLDVSAALWGEACLAMGRERAAIAIAVVSTKDPEHFRTTPGGYFHGMVAKAKAGELNLDRTLWGMRRATEPKPTANYNGRGRGDSAV